MHSDQFKPKSYLKLIKKYIFSEGEHFPLTLARPIGFLHMPRRRGGVRPYLVVSPLLELELRGDETKGLVLKFKVSCQLVTSEVKSMAHNSLFFA